MGNSAKRDVREQEHQELISKACDLRAQFLSYADIGKAMGISKPYAAKLVKEGYRQIPVENTKRARKSELERIDLLLSKNWEAAASGTNPTALGTVLRGIELRCKILGLFKPEQINAELSGPGGGPVQFAPVIMIPPERDDDGSSNDDPADSAPAAPAGLEAESGSAD